MTTTKPFTLGSISTGPLRCGPCGFWRKPDKPWLIPAPKEA